MKLRNKLAAITAAAMLAFTGVGFAAWTFNNEVNTNATANHEVTCAIEANDVTVDKNALVLVLDAPTDPTSTHLLAGSGIHWEDTSGNTVTQLNLTASFNHEANDREDHNIHYIFECAESGDLAASNTYLNYAAGSFVADEGDTTGTANVSAVYNLPTFTYTNAVKAYDTVAEVAAMENALDGKTLTLSFSFHIVSNN